MLLAFHLKLNFPVESTITNWNRIPFYMNGGVVPPNGSPPSGNYGNARITKVFIIHVKS